MSDFRSEPKLVSLQTRAQLEAEKVELMAENNAADGWGAAVSARLERIMQINAMLRDGRYLASKHEENRRNDILRDMRHAIRNDFDNDPHHDLRHNQPHSGVGVILIVAFALLIYVLIGAAWVAL